ncbi:MFS transporter [Hydrogenoanaerobacterium sp.]|uniref:MFS transporter n=1 Tax=Hydrogenoanaerobacterium sp. TaxID=2953763 RepID=UPI002896FF8D|nr:MFS transporter [Hydrogenoanaerobacterium sp.]
MTLLLIIIYISFISLGLPDSLLGSAWPVIHADLGVAVSYAGILSMIVSCGTVVSSLMSTRLIKKFGTGIVTAVSVGMTAVALIGFGFTNVFLFLCVLAIPLGLGAGSVDTALNNFVALHYKAKHMNWLHCFWGIGATCGPVIMSLWLAKNNNWHMGYLTIGIIQSVLVAVLIASLKLWKHAAVNSTEENSDTVLAVPLIEVIKIPYAKLVFLAFFCYSVQELTVGLWGGSYAVAKYGVSSKTAALWTSLYYLGITLGRFVSGFVAIKLDSRRLIRIGQIFIFLGVSFFVIPAGVWKIPIGMSLIGLGCAPVFPCMLHQTPELFGSELSQAMMGVQMACAYIGSTFMPPLFGLIAEHSVFRCCPSI